MAFASFFSAALLKPHSCTASLLKTFHLFCFRFLFFFFPSHGKKGRRQAPVGHSALTTLIKPLRCNGMGSKRERERLVSDGDKEEEEEREWVWQGEGEARRERRSTVAGWDARPALPTCTSKPPLCLFITFFLPAVVRSRICHLLASLPTTNQPPHPSLPPFLPPPSSFWGPNYNGTIVGAINIHDASPTCTAPRRRRQEAEKRREEREREREYGEMEQLNSSAF